MDMNRMITNLRNRLDGGRIGMIASHLGVVRETSRDGRRVRNIEVTYDHEAIQKILEESRALPGIVDVQVETNEGLLKVGDDILAVAVAGDIREHVFDALIRTVNRVKAEASFKKESFD